MFSLYTHIPVFLFFVHASVCMLSCLDMATDVNVADSFHLRESAFLDIAVCFSYFQTSRTVLYHVKLSNDFSG